MYNFLYKFYIKIWYYFVNTNQNYKFDYSNSTCKDRMISTSYKCHLHDFKLVIF